MNTKRNKFKFLRFFFYFIGFPCLCLAVISLITPTINEPVYEKYGKICVLVPFILWGIVELLKILLNKLAKKGSLKADVANLSLVVTTIMLVAIPFASTDIALSKQYKALQDKMGKKETVTISYVDPLDESKTITEEITMYNGATLPEYKKVLGWAVDSTTKGNSYMSGFAGECNSYISKNNLAGYGSSEKGFSETKQVNYDINLDGVVDSKDQQKIGYVRGFYDDLKFQEQGKYNYTIIAAKLNGRYNRITNVQKAYAANIAKLTTRIVQIEKNEEIKEPDNANLNANIIIDPSNNSKTLIPADIASVKTMLTNEQSKLDTFTKKYSKEIQELGGQRVRIYDDTVKALLGIIANANEILPDGLDINALGMTLPVGNIVKFLGDIVGGIDKLSPALIDTLVGAICSQTNTNTASAMYNHKYLEISTGLPEGNHYEKCAKAATGIATSNGYDYTAVKALEYKLELYPQVIVYARLRRVMYIFMGILIISLMMVDHYNRKIKQIDNIIFNEHTDKVIKDRGYVLQTALNNDTVSDIKISAQSVSEPVEIKTNDVVKNDSMNKPFVNNIDKATKNDSIVEDKPVADNKQNVSESKPLINNIKEEKVVLKEETKTNTEDSEKEKPHPVGIDLTQLQGGNK